MNEDGERLRSFQYAEVSWRSSKGANEKRRSVRREADQKSVWSRVLENKVFEEDRSVQVYEMLRAGSKEVLDVFQKLF